MAESWTCHNGHQWNAPAAAGRPLCPVCGGPPRPDRVPPELSWLQDAGTLPPPVRRPTVRSQPAANPLPTHWASVPATNQSIAGYQTLGELGRGGMGVVYKAMQVQLQRIVALKMILAGAHASPGDLARFYREARAAARLRHPNIVQIHDVGTAQGQPYFALEYVEGGSLDQRIQDKPWGQRKAAQLVQTLAEAVHAAHRHRIIHRDLKPANVLLTADDTPKITDFGLAKRLDGSESIRTQTGAILGTPAYMAPEQAEGSKEVGPAVDVYALGAILYELLTGRPPFQAATPLDTILQVLTHEPVPPSRWRPGLDRDLEAICLKCLEKEPARRYASAKGLANDLRRFLDGEAIRARGTRAWERPIRWARRRPVHAALAGVSLLACGLLGAVLLLLLSRQPRHMREARPLASREPAVEARPVVSPVPESESTHSAATPKIKPKPPATSRPVAAPKKDVAKIDVPKVGIPDVNGPVRPGPPKNPPAAKDVPQPNAAATIGRGVYLVELQPLESNVRPLVGIADHKTRRPITVKGVDSVHGLFLHPPCDHGTAYIVFNLGGKYRRLRAQVAINDGANAGRGPDTPLTFRVMGDGKQLWKSSPMRRCGRAQDCDISVAGVALLVLLVDCPGRDFCAHAVWVEPRVEE